MWCTASSRGTSQSNNIARFNNLVYLYFYPRQMCIIGLQTIIMTDDYQIPEPPPVVFCITNNPVKGCSDRIAFFQTNIQSLMYIIKPPEEPAINGQHEHPVL